MDQTPFYRGSFFLLNICMKKFILIFASAISILPFLNHRENLSLLEDYSLKTQIQDLKDLKRAYPNLNWDIEHDELNKLFSYFKMLDVGVYIFTNESFEDPRITGQYSPSKNKIYLNERIIDNSRTIKQFLKTIRHEGMHLAQDCRGGSIHNTWSKKIYPLEDVPRKYHEQVEMIYKKRHWKLEKESFWAGQTEGLTLKSLQLCFPK